MTFNANGGTGNNYTQVVAYNTATALTANTFTREYYSFTGWNTAADGSGTSYADRASVSLSANLTLYAQWYCPLAGEGTADSPYVIRNADSWTTFATDVNGGNDYSGQYVTLATDLSGVTTMVGTKAKAFKGTFDGAGHTINATLTAGTEEYCGVFANLDNANVSNLNVTGTLTLTGACQYAGAIGYANHSSYITDVTSSLVINDNGIAGYHIGGVVGGTDEQVRVMRCAFSGSITVSASTDCIGGIVGWMAKCHIINCANYGSLTSTTSGAAFLGGILGYYNQNYEANVRNCLNVGEVKSTNNADRTAAIVGYMNSNANRAYYVLPSGEAHARFALNFGDETTAIRGTEVTEDTEATEVYTLQGIRILKEAMQKGNIYIVNGRRVAIK